MPPAGLIGSGNVAGAAPLATLERFHPRPASAVLLGQLGHVHEELLRELDNMGRVTLGPFPGEAELIGARWQLGQASLRRRSLSAKILDFLGPRADDRELEALRQLRLENQRTASKSTRHAYGWTVRTINENWGSYCQASRDMAMQLKANMLLEKQLLCPILERLASEGR